MRRMLFAALAATALVVPSASAHPGTNITHGTAGGTYPTVGSGVVVAGFCKADATAASGYVVLATTVYCTVNGTWYTSAPVTTPGSTAVTVTATTAVKPLQICVYSQAVFVSGVTYTSPWVSDCYNIA